MSRLFTTAGTALAIGGAKEFDGTDLVSADFTSTTWIDIGGTTDLGSGVGDSAQLISSDRVGEGRTRKAKGTRNAGQMTVVCDVDYSDAGQIAILAAEKTNDSFPFRLTFDDAPQAGTPSQRLFIAYVMSVSETYGGPNQVRQMQITLEIDSNVVRVAAAS